MAHIELPRTLDDYFAFAETAATRNGRRFVISLPYFSGTGSAARLDRLQWWYHISPEQERQMGEAALATFRAQATERFRRHIERWLENTRQKLHGADPIPRIDALAPGLAQQAAPNAGQSLPPDPAAVTVNVAVPSSAAGAAAAEPPPTNIVEWPAERVANG